MTQSDKSQRYLKLTNIFWLIYIFSFCIVAASGKIPHDAAPLYFQAAKHWLASQPLYATSNPPYIYFSQTAIFYAVLLKIPLQRYQIFWRLITLGLLWYGAYRFSRLNAYGNYPFFFFCISLVTMLLGFGTALTGQLNIVVVDAMLLTSVAILDEQWWLAAFYLAAGFALCPAMLIMLVLTRTAYHSVQVRVFLLVVLTFISPFFLQKASYVWQQYAGAHQVFTSLNALNLQPPQLFSLIGHLGYIMPILMQNIVGFITAVLLFVFCALIKNKFAKPQFCVFFYTVTAIYLMLFNPHNTLMDYIALAPSIGFSLALGLQKKDILLVLIASFVTLGVLTQTLLGFVIAPEAISWIAPLLTLVFLVIFLIKQCLCFKFIWTLPQ